MLAQILVFLIRFCTFLVAEGLLLLFLQLSLKSDTSLHGSQTKSISSQAFSFLFSTLCSIYQYFLKKQKCKTTQKIWVLTLEKYNVNRLLHNVMFLNMELSQSFLELCHIANIHCDHTKLLCSAVLTVLLSVSEAHFLALGFFPYNSLLSWLPPMFSMLQLSGSLPLMGINSPKSVSCKWH